MVDSEHAHDRSLSAEAFADAAGSAFETTTDTTPFTDKGECVGVSDNDSGYVDMSAEQKNEDWGDFGSEEKGDETWNEGGEEVGEWNDFAPAPSGWADFDGAQKGDEWPTHQSNESLSLRPITSSELREGDSLLVLKPTLASRLLDSRSELHGMIDLIEADLQAIFPAARFPALESLVSVRSLENVGSDGVKSKAQEKPNGESRLHVRKIPSLLTPHDIVSHQEETGGEGAVTDDSPYLDCRVRHTMGGHVLYGRPACSTPSQNEVRPWLQRAKMAAVAGTEPPHVRRHHASLLYYFIMEMRMEREELVLAQGQETNRRNLERDRAEYLRIYEEKMRKAEALLRREEEELRNQERILAIARREALLHPELEPDQIGKDMPALLEDDWTLQMKTEGGLRQARATESILIQYSALPPPLAVNDFFRQAQMKKPEPSDEI